MAKSPVTFGTNEDAVRDILNDAFWPVIINSYDISDQLIYEARNRKHSAATDEATWYIWKYTWVGSNCTMIEGPLIGTQDGRASLGWRA